QVSHAAAAVAAAQLLAQLDRREVLAVTRDEVGRIEQAPVLAAAANGDEGHLGADHLTERPADAGLAGAAIAGAHLVRSFHAELRGSPRKGAARDLRATLGRQTGERPQGIASGSSRTKREHSSEAAVETRHDLPE